MRGEVHPHPYLPETPWNEHGNEVVERSPIMKHVVGNQSRSSSVIGPTARPGSRGFVGWPASGPSVARARRNRS